VAGGPSARAFDARRCHGQILAINDAVFFPFSSAAIQPSVTVFSADPGWVRRHRDFLAQFRGEKWFCLALDTWPDCAGIPGATYLRRGRCHGLSDDPGMLNTGGNSGYAAINLAVLKGAREIHLVGYDMHPSDGDKFAQWAPRFRTMLPQLQARGIQVLNHNPSSSIDAFPRIGG
jgi:hypothetical protein